MHLLNKSLCKIIVLIAALGSVAANSQSLSSPLKPSQKREIEKIVSDYLRNNPEIVIEAIEILRTREKNSAKSQEQYLIKAARNKLYGDNSSPISGNKNGDVTIVEFFDYNCGYCKKVFSFIPTLLRQDTNLRFIFKELPILSPDSEMAARAALAVWNYNKEKYFQFHKALMETRIRLSKDNVMRIAKKLGIDVTLIEKEMGSDEITKILLRNQNLARNLGIKGTPAFVIGEQIIPGAIGLAKFQKIISEIRKND